MNADAIAGFVMAGIAVLGAIGSTLILSFRVGTLNGSVTTQLANVANDVTEIRTAQERQAARFDGHIERHASRFR